MSKGKRTVKFPYGLPIHEAFELRVIRPEDPDQCWGWQGSITGKGYPQCPPFGKAHRWSLEQSLGRKLSSHEQCRHLCGNRLCTNPRHLAVGTNRDNQLDKPLHFNGKFGSASRFKLTQKEANEIRALNGKLLQREIAKLYGVTQMMVSRIITGKAWNVNH